MLPHLEHVVAAAVQLRGQARPLVLADGIAFAQRGACKEPEPHVTDGDEDLAKVRGRLGRGRGRGRGLGLDGDEDRRRDGPVCGGGE